MGIIRLMKEEFENLMANKNKEMSILQQENAHLRELLSISHEIGYPTQQGKIIFSKEIEIDSQLEKFEIS